MQAIQTRTLPATNRRGTVVSVTTPQKSILVPWDHSQDEEANHRAAAMRLVNQMHWDEYSVQTGFYRLGIYFHVLA